MDDEIDIAQWVTLEQGGKITDDRIDALVGKQSVAGRNPIEQADGGDLVHRAAADRQRSAIEHGASKAGAEKSRSTGDRDLHCCSVPALTLPMVPRRRSTSAARHPAKIAAVTSLTFRSGDHRAGEY